MAVINAPMGRMNQNGNPIFVLIIPVAYAPIPKKAAWPSETIPVKSRRRLKLILRME
jgi:hypothetical protein